MTTGVPTGVVYLREAWSASSGPGWWRWRATPSRRPASCCCRRSSGSPTDCATTSARSATTSWSRARPRRPGASTSEIRMFKAPPPEVIQRGSSTRPIRPRTTARGFSIQNVSPLPITWAEHVAAQGHWGEALREYMRDYVHWATIGALCEFLPRYDNSVTLADETDRHGLPVANFSYSQCDNDRGSIKAAQTVMEEILHGGRRRRGHDDRALRPPGGRLPHGDRRTSRRRRRRPPQLRRAQPLHHRRQRAAHPGCGQSRPSRSWRSRPAAPTTSSRRAVVAPRTRRCGAPMTVSNVTARSTRTRPTNPKLTAPLPGTPRPWSWSEVTDGDHQGLGWTYAGAGASLASSTTLLGSVVLGSRHRRDSEDGRGHGRACRNLGRPGVAACAISAVDIALWDLGRAKLDLPLAGTVRRGRASVPVYGSGGFTTYDDETTRRAARSSGSTSWAIPRVKIKIGESWGARARAGPGPSRTRPRGHRRRGALRRRQRRLQRRSRPSGSAGALSGRPRRDLVRGAGLLG